MVIRLGVIGAGTMGSAIVSSAVHRRILDAAAIVVVDRSESSRARASALGCPVDDDPRAAAAGEEILLAVKPQDFPAVAAKLGTLERPTVVISMMAGLGSRRIRAALGSAARVVRVMPNTPCQIGHGASAIAMGEGAEPGDDALARRLFGAIGATIDVREDQMHAVTAVSGSGPAYVFLMAEVMEAAAHELGLEPAAARALVQHTIVGAGELMLESGVDPPELRDAVTSEGGTTAAAMRVFEAGGFTDLLRRAIVAARNRGAELDR